ncbi:MAG: bifunctional oligoribonuclease/PAP phosphatase NrnA, partial [candidate division Zixibacteria bacterium]|nr:bifunctional oligoribonuclease/PAP phosphatase NrnA [candidate division Zixibacteria bacterium]
MRSKAIKTTPKDSDGHQRLLSRIQEILLGSSRVLIVTHMDPDGDALGTQLAFAKYLRDVGIEAQPVMDDDVPDKYRFLDGVQDVPRLDQFDPDAKFDTVLFLECPTIDRGGRVGRLLNDKMTIINIDHHQDNGGFGAVNWVDSSVSSVGEMAYEYFRQVGYEISPVVAQYLFTAILTDTGRFRYPNTSPRTMEIAGRLIEAGADPQNICDQVYYNLSPCTTKLVGRVLNSIEFCEDGAICLLTLTQQMLSDTGAKQSETEGLVDYTLFSQGVKTGALLR